MEGLHINYAGVQIQVKRVRAVIVIYDTEHAINRYVRIAKPCQHHQRTRDICTINQYETLIGELSFKIPTDSVMAFKLDTLMASIFDI